MAATASDLKEQGNTALKAGQTAEAVRFYTQALGLDPRNHLLYSNRAAAFAAQGRHDLALNDAAQVCVLEPGWVKGHVRKGVALRSLERFVESIAAYQHALRLEPQNAQVKASLAEVEAIRRDSGRNWADDLNSTDEDEPKQPAAGQKRMRAEEPGKPSKAPSPHALAGAPPTQDEVAHLQKLVGDAKVETLRVCLMQLAKADATTCERLVEMVGQLADESSEGGDEGKGSEDDESADGDDV
ncbi:hypothetical protein T492DRAFT_936296 [Pavlovales sp. CCMP2436]|nr:hypothetical protein T492DRAFT_936296 [Pavlovales sp. CCMP2436]